LLKLVQCEFLKLKRKRLVKAACATAFILPVANALLLSYRDFADIMSVVREESGFLILIPLLVITAAHLFFEEHDNDTLKNIICIPVSKSRLAAAKISALFIFSVLYELAGFLIGFLIAVFQGVPLTGFRLEFLLTLATGAFITVAALPCVILVVWCNRSYIICVIIAFFYTLLNYALHFSDAVMMQPVGLNITTFLPVPIIFRWLYQYKVPSGKVMAEFYARLSPYFMSVPMCFAVMTAETLVCTALIINVYNRQEN